MFNFHIGPFASPHFQIVDYSVRPNENYTAPASIPVAQANTPPNMNPPIQELSSNPRSLKRKKVAFFDYSGKTGDFDIHEADPATASKVKAAARKELKKCHECGTKKAPEWRKGPIVDGKKVWLCNAHGLRYRKQLARTQQISAQKVSVEWTNRPAAPNKMAINFLLNKD